MGTMGFTGKDASYHALFFLLGAALPTALFFYLASDRLGEGLSSIVSPSSWGSSQTLTTQLLAGAGHTLATDSAAPPPTSRDEESSEFAGLAELLPRVATDDRTVIITSVNEAFARPNSLLGLFRESFRTGGDGVAQFLDHVLVVAVDAMAFAHCKAVHPHCYLLKVEVKSTTTNISSESSYLSDAYLELVWTKLSLQQRVLELGYNFLFTDVDVVWLRNPFRHISVFPDMTTSSDIFHGDADSLDGNWPNTGFYYVKATSRTVEMLRRWRAARRRFPPNHEQAVFNHIKHELAADLGVRIRFLDTARFAGFCRIFHSDMAAACTVHANCCFGLANKLHDLREVLAQWRNYTGLPPQEKESRKFMWKDPTKCGTPDKKNRTINTRSSLSTASN